MSTYPRLTYKKDGTPRIPRGWRKLRPGEIVRTSDFRWSTSLRVCGWLETWWPGWKHEESPVHIHVRRKRARVINRTAPKKRG